MNSCNKEVICPLISSVIFKSVPDSLNQEVYSDNHRAEQWWTLTCHLFYLQQGRASLCQDSHRKWALVLDFTQLELDWKLRRLVRDIYLQDEKTNCDCLLITLSWTSADLNSHQIYCVSPRQRLQRHGDQDWQDFLHVSPWISSQAAFWQTLALHEKKKTTTQPLHSFQWDHCVGTAGFCDSSLQND